MSDADTLDASLDNVTSQPPLVDLHDLATPGTFDFLQLRQIFLLIAPVNLLSFKVLAGICRNVLVCHVTPADQNGTRTRNMNLGSDFATRPPCTLPF